MCFHRDGICRKCGYTQRNTQLLPAAGGETTDDEGAGAGTDLSTQETRAGRVHEGEGTGASPENYGRRRGQKRWLPLATPGTLWRHSTLRGRQDARGPIGWSAVEDTITLAVCTRLPS